MFCSNMALIIWKETVKHKQISSSLFNFLPVIGKHLALNMEQPKTKQVCRVNNMFEASRVFKTVTLLFEVFKTRLYAGVAN